MRFQARYCHTLEAETSGTVIQAEQGAERRGPTEPWCSGVPKRLALVSPFLVYIPLPSWSVGPRGRGTGWPGSNESEGMRSRADVVGWGLTSWGLFGSPRSERSHNPRHFINTLVCYPLPPLFRHVFSFAGPHPLQRYSCLAVLCRVDVVLISPSSKVFTVLPAVMPSQRWQCPR
jgi:hypothetical protein